MQYSLLLRDPVPTPLARAPFNPPPTHEGKKKEKDFPRVSPHLPLLSHSHFSPPRSPHLPTPNLSSTPDIPYLLAFFPHFYPNASTTVHPLHALPHLWCLPAHHLTNIIISGGYVRTLCALHPPRSDPGHYPTLVPRFVMPNSCSRQAAAEFHLEVSPLGWSTIAWGLDHWRMPLLKLQ